MNHYIVLDGRARYDEDEAVVLEDFGEISKEKAVADFNKYWADHDAVLFEYYVGESFLENGRLIDTAEEE